LSYGRERQESKTLPGKLPTIPYLERIVKSKCFPVGSALGWAVKGHLPGAEVARPSDHLSWHARPPAVKQVQDQQEEKYHKEDAEQDLGDLHRRRHDADESK